LAHFALDALRIRFLGNLRAIDVESVEPDHPAGLFIFVARFVAIAASHPKLSGLDADHVVIQRRPHLEHADPRWHDRHAPPNRSRLRPRGDRNRTHDPRSRRHPPKPRPPRPRPPPRRHHRHVRLSRLEHANRAALDRNAPLAQQPELILELDPRVVARHASQVFRKLIRRRDRPRPPHLVP
jgi:hypothetical protein